jgi:Ca2+-binding EF-hand superfamily protein
MKILILGAALVAALGATQLAFQHVQLTEQQPSLSREEVRERADHLFERFDVNHDGFVTRGEAAILGRKLLLLRAATGRDVAPGIGGHTLRFLEHRFAGVQAVTKQQFEDAFLAHFDQMDVNHDGILTAGERTDAH